jgi:hypothetical protein
MDEGTASASAAPEPGVLLADRNGFRHDQRAGQDAAQEAQGLEAGARLDQAAGPDPRALDESGRVVGGTLTERSRQYIAALRSAEPPPIPLANRDGDTKRAVATHSLDALNTLHGAINTLRALAHKAEAEDKLPLAILAMKEVGRLSQVYVQMQVGKTMNLNQTIKHQGEVQDWKTLPPEVRKATLEAIAREVMDATDDPAQ